MEPGFDFISVHLQGKQIGFPRALGSSKPGPIPEVRGTLSIKLAVSASLKAPWVQVPDSSVCSFVPLSASA